MHDTAMQFGTLFFDTYLRDSRGITVVDVGSKDVNGSLRTQAHNTWNYLGADFDEGKGVDTIISDPDCLPFPDDYADAVISSSCFEHSEFFWLTFNEMVRIAKVGGLIYINAPSNGDYHRFPVDCWRFYPDSGVALQKWANRQGLECTLLESFVGQKKSDVWRDFVAVFVKGQFRAEEHPNRMQYRIGDFMNGRLLDSDAIHRHTENMDIIEQRKLELAVDKVNQLEVEKAQLIVERGTKGAKIGRQITRIGGQLSRLKTLLGLQEKPH